MFMTLTTGAGVQKVVCVAQLYYAEIKHSDWFKIVMGLGAANESDLV